MGPATRRRRRWAQPERLGAPRLVLRGLEPSDAEAIVDLVGDWEVSRWTASIPHPYEPEMAESFLALAARQVESASCWHFALVLPPSPRLIGIVSARLAGRPPTAELGYWLGRPWWGQGLMGEAVKTLGDALAEAGVRGLRASALPGNAASIRIQERLGMTLSGRKVVMAPARGRRVEVEVRTIAFGER